MSVGWRYSPKLSSVSSGRLPSSTPSYQTVCTTAGFDRSPAKIFTSAVAACSSVCTLAMLPLRAVEVVFETPISLTMIGLDTPPLRLFTSASRAVTPASVVSRSRAYPWVDSMSQYRSPPASMKSVNQGRGVPEVFPATIFTCGWRALTPLYTALTSVA